MNKIFIVGIVASGKTTLAKEMSLRMDIPWYELDSVVHKNTSNGRIKQSFLERQNEINNIDAAGNWIFEGVYRDSYHCLFDLADTIIFLDTPLWKRKYRIIIRFIKQQFKIEQCNYESNIHMLKMMFKWTNDFERNRDSFTSMLNVYQDKLIIISKPSELKLD